MNAGRLKLIILINYLSYIELAVNLRSEQNKLSKNS